MGNNKLAKLVVQVLEDKKARSVVSVDVRKLTPITDYMVIATGTSTTHIKALADDVSVKVKESGHKVQGIEGKLQAEWVLVDLGGVVVHIMSAATRALYNLEELWNFESEIESLAKK